MKKFTHFMMAAALTLASFGMVACGDDDEKNNDNTTYEESSSFAFYHNGQKLEAGATIEAVPTTEEIRNDFANLQLVVENKTGETKQVCISMSKVEGPSSMNDVEVCFAEACRTFTCPFTSDPFTMEPGQASSNTITYDYTPSHITANTTYRLTVGEGSDLKNPQVVFIKHSI